MIWNINLMNRDLIYILLIILYGYVLYSFLKKFIMFGYNLFRSR